MNPDQPLSDEYLLHQARQFHTYATNSDQAAVINLVVSLDYVITLLERRIKS